MAERTSPADYGTAYAEALPEQVHGAVELQDAGDLLHDAPVIASYLRDRSISLEDKRRALEIALPDASEETHNFLLILAREDRLASLDRILQRTKEACAEREERRFAQVTSAVPLTNEEVTRIANALKRRLGKAVLIETAVDASVQAGVAVRINDWVFDATLRGRMERLKQHLADAG